jgi:[acyl-carrier-protein] S-malonyltransferase
VQQVTAPVRWEDTMAAVRPFEPAAALELGPGSVLTGLAKRLWPELRCRAVGDVAAVERAREVLA